MCRESPLHSSLLRSDVHDVEHVIDHCRDLQRLLHLCVAQTSHLEPEGQPQPCSSKIRFGEVGTRELPSPQVRPSESSAAEIGAREVTFQDIVAQVLAGEIKA